MKETVPAALAGERVDRVVSLLTGRARAEVADLVADGRVKVGGRTVTTRSRKLLEGDEVEVDLPDLVEAVALAGDPSVDVPVVHEDEHVVVIDKPAGLVVHPGNGPPEPTLVHGLLARYPEIAGVGEPFRPGIVHRLDRGTSGLLVVARTEEARVDLVGQLQRRDVTRRYDALAWGSVESPAGMIDAAIGRSPNDPIRMAVVASGKPARTRYEVVARYREPAVVTRLSCWLESGRTHQVRVHLAAIGHPIVGDARYGGDKGSLPFERPFLHAAELAFDHPATGERMRFTSPLPADLEALLARLS